MKYRSAWLVGVDDDISSRVKSWDITGAPEKNVKLAAWARDGWDNVEIFGASGMNRALSLSLSLALGAVALSSGCFLGWFQVTFLCCSAGIISSRRGPGCECQGLDCVTWGNMYLFWFGMGPSRQTRLLNWFLLRIERPGEQQRAKTLGIKGIMCHDECRKQHGKSYLILWLLCEEEEG